MNLGEVDLSRIPHKRVVQYLEQQIYEHNIKTFNEVEPSFTDSFFNHNFYAHYASYSVNASPQEVWHHYLSTSPAESWEGKRFSYGFGFNRSDKTPMYAFDESNRSVEKGQLFYVNLRLLRGVYNLAVGFEIITVDTANQVLEFSYLKGGVSQGKQRISIRESEDGTAEIIHTSYFKSGSVMRDKLLYPFFHKRIINEFHRRMRKKIKRAAHGG